MSKPFDATLNALIDAHADDWAAFLAARVGLPLGPVTPIDTDLSVTHQADRLFRIDGPEPAVLHNEAAADLPAAFERFHQRLRSPEVTDTVREKLLGSTYVLGGLRYAEDRLLELYMSLHNILEDSTTYQGIIRRGEARGRQSTLLAQGRKRFGPPTPQSEAAIRAVSDLPRLERMAERMFDATGWDDLLATE